MTTLMESATRTNFPMRTSKSTNPIQTRASRNRTVCWAICGQIRSMRVQRPTMVSTPVGPLTPRSLGSSAEPSPRQTAKADSLDLVTCTRSSPEGAKVALAGTVVGDFRLCPAAFWAVVQGRCRGRGHGSSPSRPSGWLMQHSGKLICLPRPPVRCQGNEESQHLEGAATCRAAPTMMECHDQAQSPARGSASELRDVGRASSSTSGPRQASLRPPELFSVEPEMVDSDGSASDSERGLFAPTSGLPTPVSEGCQCFNGIEAVQMEERSKASPEAPLDLPRACLPRSPARAEVEDMFDKDPFSQRLGRGDGSQCLGTSTIRCRHRTLLAAHTRTADDLSCVASPVSPSPVGCYDWLSASNCCVWLERRGRISSSSSKLLHFDERGGGLATCLVV